MCSFVTHFPCAVHLCVNEFSELSRTNRPVPAGAKKPLSVAQSIGVDRKYKWMRAKGEVFTNILSELVNRNHIVNAALMLPCLFLAETFGKYVLSDLQNAWHCLGIFIQEKT